MSVAASDVSGEARVRAALAELIERHPPGKVPETEFAGARFDAGLAWIHFAEGFGGLGLSRRLQPLIESALLEAGATSLMSRNFIGYGMAAPTILASGSDDQRRRYLRRIFTCEDIWCQLFSEPGAGSDVASLATRAVRDGDNWVIDGQKVWTSMAHKADYGMCLARTDPEAEKHKGLTYFVVDMHSPGVEVRPLRQITGDADYFNEVFLSGVRVPDSERLSAVGDGWRGALITLMNERVSIGGTVPARGDGPIATALSLWADRPAERRDPVSRARLTELWVAAEVQRLTNQRAAVNSSLGTPGPEGSTGKLVRAELNKTIFDFCIDLLGPSGMLYDPGPSHDPATTPPAQLAYYMFLRTRAGSIEGGTSEVMRNILGERVLGLPAEPRVDKGVPWSQVPRGG